MRRISTYLRASGGAGSFAAVRSARPNFVNLGRVLSIWARFLSISNDVCQFGHLFVKFVNLLGLPGLEKWL